MLANIMPGAKFAHDLVKSLEHKALVALLSVEDGRAGTLFWKDLPLSRQILIALR